VDFSQKIFKFAVIFAVPSDRLNDLESFLAEACEWQVDEGRRVRGLGAKVDVNIDLSGSGSHAM